MSVFSILLFRSSERFGFRAGSGVGFLKVSRYENLPDCYGVGETGATGVCVKGTPCKIRLISLFFLFLASEREG